MSVKKEVPACKATFFFGPNGFKLDWPTTTSHACAVNAAQDFLPAGSVFFPVSPCQLLGVRQLLGVGTRILNPGCFTPPRSRGNCNCYVCVNCYGWVHGVFTLAAPPPWQLLRVCILLRVGTRFLNPGWFAPPPPLSRGNC